ncbi:MAG: hypothetical protein Q8J63_08230, partial [Candidatus Aquicultor sp.]|nr:hypothetical protein [Candidatus Aquicultor sp.]
IDQGRSRTLNKVFKKQNKEFSYCYRGEQRDYVVPAPARGQNRTDRYDANYYKLPFSKIGNKKHLPVERGRSENLEQIDDAQIGKDERLVTD